MIRSLFTVAQLRWRVWRAMFSSSLWQESILQIMLMFTPVFYKVPVSSPSCDIRVKIKHVIVLGYAVVAYTFLQVFASWPKCSVALINFFVIEFDSHFTRLVV